MMTPRDQPREGRTAGENGRHVDDVQPVCGSWSKRPSIHPGFSDRTGGAHDWECVEYEKRTNISTGIGGWPISTIVTFVYYK